MKKLRLYICLLVLTPAVAIGALFFISGPDGQPILNMNRVKRTFSWDWSPSEKAKQLFNKAKTHTVQDKESPPRKSKKNKRFDAPIESPQETLFKWRDNKGNWHYSNQVPPDSVEFEIVEDE